MVERISRWLPCLGLAVLVALNWPIEGQRAFERGATDVDILEIADAAFAAIGTPPCRDRHRDCPFLLQESTRPFCPFEELVDTLSPRCEGKRPYFLDLPSRYVRVRHGAKRRLIAANIKARNFECRDGRHYQCIGGFDHDAAFADGWNSFYRMHPDLGGLVAVSVPVISLSGRHASMYVAIHCGVLCGAGFVLELERQASGWKVVRREQDWVS